MKLSYLLAMMLGVCLVVEPLMGGKFARGAEQDDKEEEEEDEDGEDEYGDDNFSEEDVMVLTKDNFDSTIKSKEFVLVEFYAPWCGHCKALAPEYAAAATELKEIKPDIVLSKVDATEQKDLAERFGIDGYPTLKWFVNGTASDYGGGRDEESIIRWIKKSTGPVGETVNTPDELKEFEKKNTAVILGYFKAFDKEADKTFAEFVDAAVSVDSVVLQTTSEEVAKAAGDMKQGSVVLIKNEGSERTVVPFTGALSKPDDLATFVVVESMPLTMPFNAENTEKIFNSKISRHMILVAKPDDLKPDAKVYKEFAAAAEATRSDRTFVFVTVDTDDEEGEPVIEFFGVDKSKAPMIIAFQVEPAQQKFWYEGDITKQGIVDFGKGIVDGKIEPQYQSEAIPETPVTDGVMTIVGKTFTEVTTDPKKDVMVEIYAPWCGHCQALEPEYKKLAEKFKDIDSVVIGKLDGTTNEHKDLNVDGYPTILFFPAAENAEVIEYEGEREAKALLEFINEKAKSSFTKPTLDAPTDKAEDAPKKDEEKKDEL